ncbi:hypothetical protein G7054_g6723 [Neopestalotiopsis clavispora]|nr:hypothetical protein G7054_g6723 [Neopestalotiopsis clavispora]
MASARTQQVRARERPKRAVGPPQPIYVPEVLKPKNRSKRRKRPSRSSDSKRPQEPRTKKKAKLPSRVRLGSMDSILFDPSADPLSRQDRWIPELGQRTQISRMPPASRLAPELWASYCALNDYIHIQYLKDLPEHEQSPILQRGQRTQPSERPSCVDATLWMVYRMLDGWIFRASLSAEEAITYPLMDDVMEFQCEGGDKQPVAPKGWKWEGRELVSLARADNQSASQARAKTNEGINNQETGDMEDLSFGTFNSLGMELDF